MSTIYSRGKLGRTVMEMSRITYGAMELGGATPSEYDFHIRPYQRL